MFQQKISTNWQPSALNSDVMLLLVTHTAHLFIQVLIYTNWLRCYLLWGGNNNNNNKQLLNNWEAAQCYREEGFDRKDGDWYCVFRASQLNLSQHITVPARTPSARQQTNRCSLPPFFLALSSVPTSQQWSLAHVKLPLTVQAVAGRTPNRQHPARGGGCQPGAARSFPPAGGRPRAAQSGGCRTLPRRAVARGTRRPSSQSGAFFHPRAAAARPGPAGAPPTWPAQDVASRWRQGQMFPQTTPPQGSGPLRGAITGRAYSAVTAPCRGWGSRVVVVWRARKSSINSRSKQQAAGAGIYPLIFSLFHWTSAPFWFRDKLGVIVTNRARFWWLLDQAGLLQSDLQK